MLLETKISKDDGYQKQQGNHRKFYNIRSIGSLSTETLIVWTESNGTDMALSFQEAEGCAAIWLALSLHRSSICRCWEKSRLTSDYAGIL